VPSFEIDDFKKNNQDKLFIEMDPENAFGTGHHQTTKLCLTAIFNNYKEHFAALDIGTGSGILAILLAKLGLKNILATDTDADALITAKNNALKNNTQINFLTIKENYIYKQNSFDLIIANILSGILIEMVDNITNACKKDGYIILSGILNDQAQSVIDAYITKNTCLIKKSSMDEWCLLIFRKL
jgi:ribosomal protein L11 methyltransferase